MSAEGLSSRVLRSFIRQDDQQSTSADRLGDGSAVASVVRSMRAALTADACGVLP
jgi:hypothetical protein